MDKLRQEFLVDAVSRLENLQKKLNAEPISEETEREIFRRLHTLKGTSQTFNLDVSGKLAHEIENLLHAKRDNKISAVINFQAILSAGIDLLLETFQNANYQKQVIFPADYVEKIHNFIPGYSPAKSDSENLSELITPEFLKQLSAQEKDALRSALTRGDFFYLIEVGFDFANFDERFRQMREVLLKRGEIIANFPSAKFTAQNKIGFQIFYVSSKINNEVEKILQPFDADLIFKNDGNNFSSDVKGILEQAVAAGEKTARKLSKQIEFKVSADEIKLSVKQLNLISEALLHLVRNAADHGIENVGEIKIEISDEKDCVILRVTDNGRGIDAEKVRAKAIAEKLISVDENLSKNEFLQLIFAHGFSTSEQISEISGRGVGLDAVAESVKEADGEIRVESAPEQGTTFEIRLPK